MSVTNVRKRALGWGTTVLASLMTAACGTEDLVEEPPPVESVDLIQEFESIRTLMLGKGLFYMAIAIVGGVIAIWLIKRGAIAARQRGWDAKGWVTRGATLGYVATVLIVADTVLLKFFAIAPLVTSGLLAILFVVGAIASVGVVQNLYAGAAIALRGDLRKGVHVDIGGVTGQVERTGLVSTGVHTQDGSVVQVPNRLFENEAFARRSPDRTALVEVNITQEKAVTAELREKARRVALICPYRQPGSAVTVAIGDGDDKVLHVSFQVPSEALREAAHSFVSQHLSSSLPLTTRMSQSVWLARS